MTINRTRGTIAAAMLAGLTVLAGCGGSDSVESNDTPPVVAPPVVTPSTTSTPSATPSGTASPSGSATPGTDAEFLAASDWPTGTRYGTWKAQGEQDGLPDPEYVCIEDVLPADDTEYQLYTGDLEAEGRQFIVETDSVADAEKLVTELNTAIDGCVEAYKKANPNDDASGEKLGTLDAGDGVTLTARYFVPKDSEYTMQLFAVGRSGSTVTVVTLGQGGKADEAPKDAFKATVTKAMEKVGADD